jgi:hypothetical protein
MFRLLFMVLSTDFWEPAEPDPPRIFYPPRRLWRYIAAGMIFALFLIAPRLREPWGDYLQ